MHRPVRCLFRVPLFGLLLTLALSLSAARLHAQIPTQRPTPEQARELLRTRPDLVRELRRRLLQSGLTPDQVRARLRAAGYPENLLDDYLSDADTTVAGIEPGRTIVDATRQLGVLSAEEADSLRLMADSLALLDDSLALDSLDLAALDTLDAFARDSALEARRRMRVRDTTEELRTERERERGLEVFGLEIFRRRTTQFQPALGGPVGANYRLGPGDELVLILTGDVEVAHELTVTREGFIAIPQVGQLQVANLTLGQLEDLLYTRLGRVYSGVRRSPNASTRFSVTLSRIRTNQVFVVGDVDRPGAYQVAATGTALSALYAAGGPTENGSMRQVQVRRGGTLVDSLDLYDYLLLGDNRHDVRLETGDVVFVPVRGPQAKVTGAVVRPAIYELKPGETLRDLLRAAGGFEARAFRRRVQIDRILPPSRRGPLGRDRVVIDLASDQFVDGMGPPFPIEPGDSVIIFEVAERRRNLVRVTGAVMVSGDVGFTDGMKLSEALRLAGGPQPDAYLGQILISRLRADSSRVQLRSAFRDSLGAVTDDIVLQEDDEIRVFSRFAFRENRYVVVTGAVRRPGRVPYREGMTLRDAVLEADGLTEAALLTEAEIARLAGAEARDSGRVAHTVRVPLDSTYLFERGPDGGYQGPPGVPAPAAGAGEVVLQPYDNVLILRQPEWELPRTVALAGEVRFPGRYTLRSRTERLSDLIARAGGLTEEAYPAGITFIRVSEKHARIGVDLPRVLKDPRFRDNIILAAGDSILIPEYNPVVFVRGAVNAPTAVAYVNGRNLDYYVNAAGGYSRLADQDRSYVTQPNGKIESITRRFLLADGVPRPAPGAVVFVPEKDPQDRTDYVPIITAVAQVLASVVTVVVVLTR